MFFRKVHVSEECMNWLRKAESHDVNPDKAEKAFEKRCNQVQEDVLKALTTVSKEPASADGKSEIVVEVRLAKAEEMNTMLVVTRVYAVVYTKNKKRYYVALDKNGQPKKVSKMGEDMAIYINGGDYIEVLKTIQSKKYRISM